MEPPSPSSPVVQPAVRSWSGRSLGGETLFRVCAALLPWVGSRGAWVGSWIIAAGFLLAGRRAQYGLPSFWRRLRPGISRPGLAWRLWRHYASFGRILCDRLLGALRPDRFAIDQTGAAPQIHQAVAERRGCILLSAHLGAWELSETWMRMVTGDSRACVVMQRGELPGVQSFVDRHLRSDGVEVIDPRDGIGASLAVARALADGRVVCMLGDRVAPGQAAAEAPFLGRDARFPTGPFHAAVVSGAPIFVCFMVKTGLRSYRVEVDAPWQLGPSPRGSSRDAVVAAAVRRWAQRLERQARAYPFQWHNFFDFWRPAPANPAGPATPAVEPAAPLASVAR